MRGRSRGSAAEYRLRATIIKERHALTNRVLNQGMTRDNMKRVQDWNKEHPGKEERITVKSITDARKRRGKIEKEIGRRTPINSGINGMANQYQICAMKERHIGIACVCTKARYVVFDNGIKLPITGFLDDDHNATDDPEQFSYFEFGTEEFGHGVGNFDSYNMPSWEEH